MKSYIGTKVVKAVREDTEYKTCGIPQLREGYKVIYEDGYESWSPREVFERCYREISISEKDLIK